jgi:Domain of unknown function (DUF4258)
MTPTALHQGRVDKTSTLAIIPHASGVEPFDPATTRQRIRSILERGRTGWSRHALSEMAKDDLTTVDIVNVLRGGTVRPGEFERGSWRYQVLTSRIFAVIAFRSSEELVVVTAWRIRP